MTYICKTVVIVHVDGKRKEFQPGAPLPAGLDDDTMDDLIRLRAIERDSTGARPASKLDIELEPEHKPEDSPASPAESTPGRKAK